MNVYITGHTSGLGKELHDWFVSQGYNVEGFSKSNGYDINKDFVRILNSIPQDSLFVNNAYADGVQENFIHELHNKVDKMIVVGSIASRFPDDAQPKYSEDKKRVEDAFYKYATHAISPTDTRYLLLNITSSAYENPTLIKNTIRFWLDNPGVLEVGYNVT